jgi:predicted dithiol-disulfide oxidoreductase (DUF899 family)
MTPDERGLYPTDTPRGGLQAAIDYLEAIIEHLEETEDTSTLAVHLRQQVTGLKQLESDMGWARDYTDTDD